MGIYDPLRDFLRSSASPSVAVTFGQIEDILHRPLPRSAYAHESWWSNNTDGHSHARAWVEAGRRAEQVDLGARSLVFSVTHAARGAVPDPFGALRGSVTFVDGVDLTQPDDDTWDAAR